MAGSISILGKPTAKDSSGRVITFPSRAFALVALMIFDGNEGIVSRAQAAEFLWEDEENTRRSGNLRQLLRRIRSAQASSNEKLFYDDEDRICLLTGTNDIDLLIFQDLVRSNSGEAILPICQAYGGTLLDGLDLKGARASHWLQTKRQYIKTQFIESAGPHIEKSLPNLQPEQALFAANRIIEADPYNEEAYRALMRVHASANNIEFVQRAFDKLTKTLKGDLNVSPSTTTTGVVDQIINPPQKPAIAAVAGPNGPASSNLQINPVQNNGPRLLIKYKPDAKMNSSDKDFARSLVQELITYLWRARSLKVYYVEHSDDVQPMRQDVRPTDYQLEILTPNRGTGQTVFLTLYYCHDTEILFSKSISKTNEAAEFRSADLGDTIIKYIENNEISLPSKPDELYIYRQVLIGKRLMRNVDLPSVRRARSVFKAALANGNRHVGALAGLSKTLRLEWLLLGREQRAGLEQAKQIANQAVQFGRDLPDGFHQLGMCEIYDRNFSRGLQLLQKSLVYGHLDLDMRVEHADARIMAGEPDAGLAFLQNDIDSESDGNDLLLWIAATGKYFLGDYHGAIEYLERSDTVESAFHLRAASHAMLGDKESASKFASRTKEMLPDFTIDSRVKLVPISRSIDEDRMTTGLRLAGFD